MANWRKNQEISNHQVGHWRSSSYNGKPPLDNRFPTVPSWEKKFCASVGSVPWKKIIEGKRYMYMHPNVVNWEDSAVKESFDNAKNRFWAEINGFPCNIPLPDPDMYIDEVDWDASVDPELYLDLDREVEARRDMIEKSQETVILGSSLLLNQSLSGPGWGIEPTGWGDDEEVTKPPEPNPACGWGWGAEEVIKPPEPSYAAEGWGSYNLENNETNSWEQNDSQRWIPKDQYGGYLDNKYQANYGGNRNWGAWEGNSRRRENSMSWSKNPAYQYGNNEYTMNRGRKNGGRGGGGRRGNYTYAAKVAATPGAW